MKIGIMGGTFDPVHYGHLLLAERFRVNLGLDKIVFIPTGMSYHKNTSQVTSSERRYEMLEMAIKDNPHFMLSDIEIKRSGNSYTCDTVKDLKEKYPDVDFYFLIGTDILFSIENWKNIDWLFKEIKFLLALREGHDSKLIEKQLKHLVENRGADIVLREFDLVNISSSKIREQVKNQKSIKYLLPLDVEEYILENNLYADI